MAQLTATQTVSGGAQFNGSGITGLFSFNELEQLPRQTANIVCDQLGIYTPTGAALDWVTAYFSPPPGDPGGLIPIGTISGAFLASPDGARTVKFCPGIVPRSAAGFYRIQIFSSGADSLVTANLAYRTEGVA